LVDLKRSAMLLQSLAEGKTLAEAAEQADLDLSQAKAALADLAERLENQAKKWQAELDRQFVAVESAKKEADDPDALIFAFDGGSRGNPGPAAGAAVAVDADGKVLLERFHYFPKATNNFAEYQGLIAAIEMAVELGVKHLGLQGDSELVVKQMRGEYKVKNKSLLRLYIEANNLLKPFAGWEIRYVPREENVLADQVVNRVLDEKAPKKKKNKKQP